VDRGIDKKTEALLNYQEIKDNLAMLIDYAFRNMPCPSFIWTEYVRSLREIGSVCVKYDDLL